MTFYDNTTKNTFQGYNVNINYGTANPSTDISFEITIMNISRNYINTLYNSMVNNNGGVLLKQNYVRDITISDLPNSEYTFMSCTLLQYSVNENSDVTISFNADYILHSTSDEINYKLIQKERGEKIGTLLN